MLKLRLYGVGLAALCLAAPVAAAEPAQKAEPIEVPYRLTVAKHILVRASIMGRKTTPETAPRGYLGVELIDKDEIITILAVLDGSPAAQAGLKPGDQLIKFQDRTILNVEDVRRFVDKLQPGETVTLTVQ